MPIVIAKNGIARVTRKVHVFRVIHVRGSFLQTNHPTNRRRAAQTQVVRNALLRDYRKNWTS